MGRTYHGLILYEKDTGKATGLAMVKYELTSFSKMRVDRVDLATQVSKINIEVEI